MYQTKIFKDFQEEAVTLKTTMHILTVVSICLLLDLGNSPSRPS